MGVHVAPEYAIGETLEEVFNSVVPAHTYIPSFGPWGFFMAAQHKLDNTQHNIHEGKFIGEHQLPKLFSLPSDYARLAVDPNTIRALPILRYYEKGWEFVNNGNATP